MKLHHKIILTSMIALSLPISAQAAGEVKRVGSVVEYSDKTNSTNAITVGRRTVGTVTGFIVQDSLSTLVAKEGCTLLNTHQALCGLSNPSKTKMFLSGGNDSAGLYPGDVPDVALEVHGGSGIDTIDGSDLSDFLEGQDGSDIIHGLDGADVIDGGTLANPLFPDLNGNDRLYGDGGNDIIRGGFGSDTLVGGSDNDRLEGNAGGDLIKGDAGNDRLDGGPGSDNLTGSTGIDTYFGGAGSDRINADDNIREDIDCGFADFAQDLIDLDNPFGDNLINCFGEHES